MKTNALIGLGIAVIVLLIAGAVYYLGIINPRTHSIAISSYVKQLNATTQVRVNYTLSYINGTILAQGKTKINESVIFSGIREGSAANLRIGGAYNTGGVIPLNGTATVQNIFIPINRNSTSVIQESICLNC